MATLKTQKSIAGWLFVTPFLVSLSLFFLYAAIRTFLFSFTDFDLFNDPNIVGFANYIKLFSDRLFLLALTNTMSFAILVTSIQTFLAMLLAIQVNKAVRGKSIVRTVFYVPSIMSSAAMTLIFLWLFQREGLMTQFVEFLINYRLHIIGFFLIAVVVQILLVLHARRTYSNVSWMDPFFLFSSLAFATLVIATIRFLGLLPVGDEQLLISWLNTQAKFLFMPKTLWSVALMNIFTTVPTLMLLFLAGLQSIPEQLYEAAKIDGANAFHRFRDITVPSLAPVTFAVVTLGIIGTLQMFDQVAILGDAAPLESRVTLAYFIYDNAFPGGASPRVGIASAAAIILGVLTLSVVYLQRALGIKDTVN